MKRISGQIPLIMDLSSSIQLNAVSTFVTAYELICHVWFQMSGRGQHERGGEAGSGASTEGATTTTMVNW